MAKLSRWWTLKAGPDPTRLQEWPTTRTRSDRWYPAPVAAAVSLPVWCHQRGLEKAPAAAEEVNGDSK